MLFFGGLGVKSFQNDLHNHSSLYCCCLKLNLDIFCDAEPDREDCSSWTHWLPFISTLTALLMLSGKSNFPSEILFIPLQVYKSAYNVESSHAPLCNQVKALTCTHTSFVAEKKNKIPENLFPAAWRRLYVLLRGGGHFRKDPSNFQSETYRCAARPCQVFNM